MAYVFVYGTLRPGQANHGLVRSAVIARTLARLDNDSLRADALAAYPYAVEDRGHSVIGDLLELKPGTEEAVLRRLDALEGYRPNATGTEKSHYLRVRRTVTTISGHDDRGAAGPVSEAWVYLAGPAVSAERRPLVPSVTGQASRPDAGTAVMCGLFGVMARIAVWRGFDSADTLLDKTLLHHRTVA